jgi:hypothetical protein
MKIFRVILGLIRRFFMFIFVFYWVVFVGYTVTKFVEGGSSRVASWYRQIGTPPIVWNGETFVFHKMNWGMFWRVQVIYLAITLALFFWEWRTRKKYADSII